MIVDENKGWQKIPEDNSNKKTKDYYAYRLYIKLANAKTEKRKRNIRKKLKKHFDG